jgi:hypothetical protein
LQGNPNVLRFGGGGDLPVVGTFSFSGGHDTIGVYRPGTPSHPESQWFLQGNPNGVINFGGGGDLPVDGEFFGPPATAPGSSGSSPGAPKLVIPKPPVVNSSGDLVLGVLAPNAGTLDATAKFKVHGRQHLYGSSGPVAAVGPGAVTLTITPTKAARRALHRRRRPA